MPFLISCLGFFITATNDPDRKKRPAGLMQPNLFISNQLGTQDSYLSFIKTLMIMADKAKSVIISRAMRIYSISQNTPQLAEVPKLA